MYKRLFLLSFITLFLHNTSYPITQEVSIVHYLQNNMHNLEATWSMINNAKKITLLGHHKPDGDAISSTTALSIYLESMGKEIEVIYPNAINVPVKKLPKKYYINKHEQHPDLLIACDTANYARIYPFKKHFPNTPVINIDHHGSNEFYGIYNFVVKDASSCCEVLYEIMKLWNPQMISKEILEVLLYGILTDTNVLRNQATHPSTFRVVSEITKADINFYELQQEYLADKNAQEINLWGKLLKRVKDNKNKTIAWTYITQDDLENLQMSCIEGLVNFLNARLKTDIIILIREPAITTKSVIKTTLSIRTKKTNANLLAKSLAKHIGNTTGGGHAIRAGMQSEEPTHIVIEKVTSFCKAYA